MRTLDQFDLGIAPIGMVAIFPFALVALAESKHRQQIKLKSAARMKYTLMAITLLVSILPFYVWQILDDTTTYAIATYSSIGLVLTVHVITLKLSNLPGTEISPE